MGPVLLEVELVEPTPKRNLYLAAFAATVTVLVVAAVLAGPAIIACSQSSDGLVACLRQRIVETGLLPPGQPAVVVATPQAPEPEAPSPAPAEPAPAEPAVAAAAPPAMTLLRAEPDGSLVIAGTGSPGAQIEVYADGEPLGTTTAEPSGDWVVVPDEPLTPGGVEISVGEAGSETRAEQSFVVVIDPDRATEPLVVATSPGEASAVLQGLPRRPEAPPREVAAIPEPEATAPAPATITPAPEAPAPQPEAAAPEPEAAAPPSEPEPEASPSPQIAATEPEPQTPVPSTTPPAASEPAPTEDPEPADLSVVNVEPEVAEPEPSPTPPVVIVPPSIDAIEIDGTANFFAGGGAEGATVRLYVNDKYVADAKVTEGRWLVEATDVLTLPSQRVRIDMLKPGTAEVAARAEVNFVVDLPPAAEPESPPVDVAEPAPVPQPEQEPAPSPEPTIVAEPVPDAAAGAGVQRDLTATAEAEPKLAADRDLAAAEKPAAEAPTAPDLAQLPKEASQTEDKVLETANVPDAAVNAPKLLESPAKPSVVAPEPTPAPQIATTPEPTPQPLSEEPAAAPAAPAKPAVQAKPAAPATTKAAPAKPAVVDEPEPVAPPATVADVPVEEEEPIPTLKAVPVGDPESMRFASGKAIIRRGDNLWTISRRVYGRGIKYTTIYHANKDQIRNPSRIYPGQVFDLPPTADE